MINGKNWKLGGVIAFGRQALRKSLLIGAIVVNHEVVLDPLQFSLALEIQILCVPRLVADGRPTRSLSPWPNAGVFIEVSVRCGERSQSPICLH